METVALIWFFAMLIGSSVVIGYDAGQKTERLNHSQVTTTETDAGSLEVWKGDESSSVRVYWDKKGQTK